MGNGNKAEMLIAICAVLTSVIALFVAWDQGRVMRAQQHGAVFPVVQIDGFVSTSSDMASMGLRLSNSGVGPALIESVRMLKDGEPVESLLPYAERFPAGYERSWSSLIGRAIAPGDKVVPLRVDWPHGAVSSDQLNAAAADWGRLDLEICYCSVFKRCWIAHGLGKALAEPVKRCERSDTDIFEELALSSPAPEPSTTSGVE